MPFLYYYSYNIEFKALDSIFLPAFSGSSFRGAFGHALRNLSCINPDNENHENCIIRDKCPYYFIFESVMNKEEKGFTRYPHPFVLYSTSHDEIKTGDSFNLFLKLVGNSNRFLPYIIMAFKKMGIYGLGKGRGKFALVNVFDINSGSEIYNSVSNSFNDQARAYYIDSSDDSRYITNEIEMEFATPLRLKKKGRYIKSPSFEDLIRASMRRYSLLARGYCDFDPDFDYADLIETAHNVKSDFVSARWNKIMRYSSRQDRKTPLYGVSGKAKYTIEHGSFKDFAILLEFMENLNIGGATAFGFGNIILNT